MDIRKFFKKGSASSSAKGQSADKNEGKKLEADRAEGACLMKEAAEFFSFLENVYSFFSTSLVNHHKFKEAQSKLGIASAELVQLSNTRWACQLRSINAVLDTLTAIFDCLSAIGSPMAVGLRAKLHKFSTVYLLLMFQSLLSITEGLHKFLQKETVDLAEACFGKQAVCDTLIGKRTDAFATELYDRTKALCEIHNIPEADAARKRKQRKMGDFVVETSLGLGTELSCSQTLKTELLPCLDRMVCELDQRFSTVDAGLLKDIQACSPNSKNFLDTSCLTEFAKHYGIDVKTEEMLVARNFLARKREAGCPPKDMLAVHNLLDDDMFPSLKEIIQVALTIPVSSCSCERSFSALCRLHSWLRKTMGQKRLASLAAMSIEGEVLGPLSHNSVIDRFATFKNRRYTLMRPPTK
ncbi:Zinc finger MYM-type protein 1 [Acipenser ruthenus]|uniref:Zinc finger MYM-type protein 1 n=1 Tax=Acipenser ruthenus TaxID=7906 RepID=A0A444U3R9_ACIRT|nr:Zinc finger MYM-type protein 1 [Acipenser ruthenus]